MTDTSEVERLVAANTEYAAGIWSNYMRLSGCAQRTRSCVK